MFKQTKNLVFATVVGIFLVMSQGCAPLVVGAAAGAGGFAFLKGNLVKNVDSSVAEVHKAALSALKNLDLFVTQDELNRHSGKIQSEYADGKKVVVVIQALTEKSSKIKIKIGVFGDQNKSITIMNAIQKKL